LFFFSHNGCISTELTSTTADTRITSIIDNTGNPSLSDVERVSIEYATVTFIPDFKLVTKQLPKFNQLGINYSGLKYVERRQMASMPQLTQLDLNFNQIEDLPEDVFDDLVNLVELEVSSNKIKVLPPKLLWNLPKLKHFWADDNQIKLIPRDFFKNNREMEYLWINDNKITRIEVDFTLLPKLTALNLSSNTCINDDVCNPCEIEKLRPIQQKINRNCAGIA
jgi:Leucine-rich repeat (LRR) protein